MIRKLNNPNPTKAEKQLFFDAGYYCLEKGGTIVNNNNRKDWPYYPYMFSYAIIRGVNQKTFPQHLEIDEKDIDYDSEIVFDTLSETIKISADLMDIDLMFSVIQRMNELCFGTFSRKRQYSVNIKRNADANKYFKIKRGCLK